MASNREKPSPATGSNAAGRADDERGRNVWHFHGEQLDSTTIMLSRLENDALELEPTRSVPIPGGAQGGGQGGAQGSARRRGAPDEEPDIEATLDVGAKSGFDPYNRS